MRLILPLFLLFSTIWLSCDRPAPTRVKPKETFIRPIYPSDKSHWDNLKILYNYSYIRGLDTVDIRKMDTLCTEMANQILPTVPDLDSQKIFVYVVAQYYANRASDMYEDRIIDSTEKYNKMYLRATVTDSSYYVFERARCINNVGWVFQNKGKISEAYDYVMRAKSLFSPNMPSETKAEIEDQLANIYANLFLLDSSIACINRALVYMDSPRYRSRYRNSSSGFLTGLKMFHYIKLYVVKSDPSYVDSFYKTSAVFAHQPLYPSLRTWHYILLSHMSLLQEKYQDCIVYADSSALYIEATQIDKDDCIKRYTGLKGLSYLLLGNSKMAWSLLDKARADFNKDEIYYTTLSQYEEKKKDYKNALFFLQKSKKLRGNVGISLLNTQGKILTLDKELSAQKHQLQLLQIKNKEIKNKWLISIIIAVLLIVLLLLLLQNKKNKATLHTLAERIQNLTDKQIILIKEAEQQGKMEARENIGISLHNNLASIIAVTTQFLRNSMAESSDLPWRKKALELADVLQKNYQEVRDLSHHLNDNTTFTSPFCSVLYQTVNVFFINTGIKVNTNIDPANMNEIPINLKILVLEILKEAATNIVKHSKATQIDILIYEDLHCIYMEVNNNGVSSGCGRKTAKNNGLGLDFMRKRVLGIGGKIEVVEDNNHFTLKIVLPFA